MRIGSQGNAFSFSLPSDYLPQEIILEYQPILDKNWVQYSNVIDYLNSTIKSVTFPGISIDMPEQRLQRGKKRAYKPATPAQDIVTSHELSVVFRSVDADLNYWLMFDIFYKHYLDTKNMYLNPFLLSVLDIWRDTIYVVKFFEINNMSLSDNLFDYSSQKVNTKEFTMVFKFNFVEVEFMLSKSKILETGSSNVLANSSPIIIQKK